jgi:hypothetical protein
MQLKDKQYLANIYSRIQASVSTINAKILGHQNGTVSLEELQATAAIEQLSMQQETLLMLAILVADPDTKPADLPQMPKKIIGFK